MKETMKNSKKINNEIAAKLKLVKKSPGSNNTSMEFENEGANFDLLDEEDRKAHILNLWKKAFLKGRGGAQIIRFFSDLSRKIYLFGVNKRLEEIELEELPPAYII